MFNKTRFHKFHSFCYFSIVSQYLASRKCSQISDCIWCRNVCVVWNTRLKSIDDRWMQNVSIWEMSSLVVYLDTNTEYQLRFKILVWRVSLKSEIFDLLQIQNVCAPWCANDGYVVCVRAFSVFVTRGAHELFLVDYHLITISNVWHARLLSFEFCNWSISHMQLIFFSYAFSVRNRHQLYFCFS